MKKPPIEIGLTPAEIRAVLALGDDTAIAAAIRLIEIQQRSGGLADDAQTARRLQLGKPKWRDVRTILMDVFEIRDGIWTLPALADRQTARSEQRHARSERAMSGWKKRRTTERHRPNDTPNKQAVRAGDKKNTKTDITYDVAPRKPPQQNRASDGAQASSAKKAFDRGISLLMTAGYTETRARENIGFLRKQFGDDVLLVAITETARRTPVEPFAYLSKVAADQASKGNKTKSKGEQNAKPRLIATPETMGLSDGLTQKIRESAQYDPGYVFTDVTIND